MSGITPATVSLLLIHLKNGRFNGFVAAEGQGGEAVTTSP